MTTLFKLLHRACGLSNQETADYLSVRIDTVKSWSSGRNPAPEWAISMLRALLSTMDGAAEATRDLYNEIKPDDIFMGYCTDDTEAQSLGYPTASAQHAALAMQIARLPLTLPIRLGPRGADFATAAAADAHDK